jgi:hypothetical protein
MGMEVTHVLLLLEGVHWDYARGKKDAAKRDIVTVITHLNGILKSGVSGDEGQLVKSICHDSMTLYEMIKNDKPLPFDQTLQWLSSFLNGAVYPPVLYDHIHITSNDPFDDQLPIPLEFQDQLQSYAEVEDQEWSTDGITHIYQDLLQNCSFVTALISLSRNNSQNLLQLITPHNQSNRYAIQLHFNGCERLVEVGNSLPRLQDKSLYVQSQTNPRLIWPAFLEKAYLKIHGHGYDFKGSNASIDTFILSGWIPEFITSLQGPDMILLWEKLYHSFQENKVLLALGTGNSASEYASNHDYSISEMHDRTRTIVVKNPWRRSTSVINFNEVFEKFDTLYLNWNPKELLHKKMNLIHPGHTKIMFKLPQFHLENATSSSSTCKILLEKHLGSEPSSINLGVFQSHGEKLFTKTLPIIQNFANNTGFHLTEVTLKAGQSVTIIVFNDSIQPQNFTLHVYSPTDIILRKALPRLAHLKSIESSWNVDSCGGNWSYQSYAQNPQYLIDIPENHTNVELTLELYPELDTLVNMQLFFEDSKPFSPKTSIINEKYSPGFMVKTLHLKPSQKYKLVLSTYDPDVITQFKLLVSSSTKVDITPISTRLGLFTKPFKFCWNNKNRFKIFFKPPRATTLNVHIWTPNSSLSSYRPAIRASLFYKDGTPISVNSEFDDYLHGIWIQDARVDDRDQVILLVERFEAGNEELQGEIGSDFKLELIK